MGSSPERCPVCGHKDRLIIVCGRDAAEQFIECESCKATFREARVLVPYDRPKQVDQYLVERVNELERRVSLLSWCMACDQTRVNCTCKGKK